MKTVTKREDFTYIVYDEELKRKCDIVLSLHVILWILIPTYILLFRANDKIYNYLWIIFYVFFIISYRLEPYLSKKEYENKKVLVGYNEIDGKEVTMSKFKEDINQTIILYLIIRAIKNGILYFIPREECYVEEKN